MICNSSSVLFVNICFIVCCCYLGFGEDLRLLILSSYMIFKCSTDEYLIIHDWEKFQSLNLACSNQSRLSDQSLDLFKYGSRYSNCDAKNQSFSVTFNLTSMSSAKEENQNITDEQMQLLSSIIIEGNHTYSFIPTRINDSQRVIFNQIQIEYTSDRRYKWYAVFQEQPIACLFAVNYAALIVNETCTGKNIWNHLVCYYDPLSASPLENINWILINDFIFTSKYLPDNWGAKGAILYSPLSQTTVTTSVSRR